MIKSYINQLKTNSEGLFNCFDIICSGIIYGASPNNYKNFGFKELNHKQRATYVTNRISRKMIKTFNDPDYIDIFEDKIKFAERFSKYFGRTWISTKNLTYSSFLEFVKDKDQIIYKPINNAQGQGIKVFKIEENPENIFNRIIAPKEDAIIEEWIEQHPVLSNIYSEAINCLRIITVYKNRQTFFLTGGITWGNGKKIANASASGIVSPVNFKTGILDKPAADFEGHVYEKHPITNVNLMNLKVPYWDETIEMLKRASSEIPQVGYVGWDIAITPNGPVLIEGNTTPGYKYYQIPAHMINKTGNKEIYTTCLRKQ